MGMRYVKKDDTKKEGTDMQSIKIYVTVSEISMIVQELLLLGRWEFLKRLLTAFFLRYRYRTAVLQLVHATCTGNSACVY